MLLYLANSPNYQRNKYHIFWEEQLNDLVRERLETNDGVWVLFGHDTNEDIDTYKYELLKDFDIQKEQINYRGAGIW